VILHPRGVASSEERAGSQPSAARGGSDRVPADVGIVGGGLTGLALAHELGRRGVRYRLFEARTAPGGVMATRRVDGQPLDLGPQRIRLTRSVTRLIEEVGLAGEVVRAPEGLPLWMVRGGRLRRVPYSFGETVRGDLFTWRGKLRLLLEPLTRDARPDETVGSLLRRKFGREGYAWLLGPLYGGLFASDPDRMLVRHAFSGLRGKVGARRNLLTALWEQASGVRSTIPSGTFRDGMRALPEALARACGDSVHLGTSVRGIRRGPRRGFRLEIDGGAVEVGRIVLTVPADRAARLLRPLAPDAAERLAFLRYNPLALVHLRSAARLQGFGFKVAFGEDLRIRGVTYNDAIFGRTGLFTAFLGGMEDPGALQMDDDALGSLATSEFTEVTGCAADVLHVHRTRIPSWDRSWEALDGLSLPFGIHLASGYTGRPGVPGRLAEAEELAETIAAEVGAPPR